MALVSPVLSWQNKPPKMVAASICVPRVNPSNLLSLQEPLQDQQEGLTQASFKLLPLLALKMCELSWVSFKSSLFPTALLLCHTLPLAYSVRSSGGLSSWCKSPGSGSPIWDLDPLLLGDNLCICDYLVCGSPTWGLMSWLHSISVPPTCLTFPSPYF